MRIFKLVGKTIDLVILPIDIMADWLNYAKDLSDTELAKAKAELALELKSDKVPPAKGK